MQWTASKRVGFEYRPFHVLRTLRCKHSKRSPRPFHLKYRALHHVPCCREARWRRGPALSGLLRCTVWTQELSAWGLVSASFQGTEQTCALYGPQRIPDAMKRLVAHMARRACWLPGLGRPGCQSHALTHNNLQRNLFLMHNTNHWASFAQSMYSTYMRTRDAEAARQELYNQDWLHVGLECFAAIRRPGFWMQANPLDSKIL